MGRSESSIFDDHCRTSDHILSVRLGPGYTTEWNESWAFSRALKSSARPPELRPPRSMWWWLLPAALLIGVAAWVTMEWLLHDVGTAPVGQISIRIEAARTALAEEPANRRAEITRTSADRVPGRAGASGKRP